MRSGIHAALLVRDVAREAYSAGAVNVEVSWIDDEIERARFLKGGVAADSELSAEAVVMARAGERGDSFLRLFGEAPDRMADVDSERLSALMGTVDSVLSDFDTEMRSLGFYWTVALAPSEGWAKLVFPDLPEEGAVNRLWEAVLATCRVDEADPIAAWESHLDHLDARQAFLNEQAFTGVRYDVPGTNLVVGLPGEHRWNHPREGHGGRRTVANMPAEEVATSPHRDRADGVGSSNKAGRP